MIKGVTGGDVDETSASDREVTIKTGIDPSGRLFRIKLIR